VVERGHIVVEFRVIDPHVARRTATDPGRSRPQLDFHLR
jgi:hypothetical protein